MSRSYALGFVCLPCGYYIHFLVWGREVYFYLPVEPPAGQLRLASSKTTQFTANLIKAVSSMFPSKLFSTGGDEINQECYAKDPQTQQDLRASQVVP